MNSNIHRPQCPPAAGAPPHPGMQPVRGFTLLELVVTVAIIGILAAVAVPGYSEYMQRGRLTEAFRTLADMQVKLNQYFLDQRSFIGACAAGTLAPLPGSTAYFSYSCPTLSATDYEVDATGRGAMAGFAYTLSLSGGSVTKATASVPSGWDSTNASTCWVFKRDGSC